ncbi:T9SS type A sorting domain-containing protein [Winogradskyella sp. PE311]|uniref:T9SS type A sorting domain-containing protein n=1 Tax=Winogradskyella sp. PE311 TaxID=3366943 RepID=UPI00397FF615
MKKKYFYTLLMLPLFLTGQVLPITSTEVSDLSAYGETTTYPGLGEYEIFLSADNILDKPIIVVDGFDPGDVRDIAGIYSLLDFTGTSGDDNLADLVRAQDFDVVILNFPEYLRLSDNSLLNIDNVADTNGDMIIDEADFPAGSTLVNGGADFIERNAMILVELLDVINTAKATNSPEQNVIIGPSMGGLITRYALNYMESENINTDTRLYISFDVPHLGANIPIGLQHQLNYLAFNDTNPVPEVQPIIDDLLRSPASRQLLIDHLDAHLADGSLVEFNSTLPEPHPFRVTFDSNINSLTTDGFPQGTRNIAIINGSGIGNPYFAMGDSGTTVSNGFTIISTVIPVSVPTPFGNVDIDVEIDVNMTPAAGSPAQVSRFFAPIPVFPDVESIASSERLNFDGVDAAPGGLFDISALTGEITAGGDLAADFLAALEIDKFSYIPAVSALALEITNDDIDWFHNIDLAGRATTNNTPFDNTFLPDNNEPHVQLTQNNVTFALDEIFNPVLGISNNEKLQFKLEKNPIDNEIVLISNNNSNATVNVIDITGKIVFSSTQVISNRTTIPVNLNSGFYLLNITSENNTSFAAKFLVK